jgi:erythromycin esterase-like protein
MNLSKQQCGAAPGRFGLRMTCRVARCALLLAAAACGNRSDIPRARIEPVVARDATFFGPDAVPDALAAALAGRRVVLLGETHYVQEHQDFLVRLLPRLHAAGFRFILQEDSQAMAWPGEEYAMLRSDELPDDVAAFDRTLLSGLRAFNASLPEAERIHFAGFDMNHSDGLFGSAAAEFQRRFGQVPQLEAALGARPRSSGYAVELDTAAARLEAEREGVIAIVGAGRYAELVDLVDVERKSVPVRSQFTDDAREAIIRERVAKALAAAGSAAVAVNTGMNHAQKEKFMGATSEYVGTWLKNHPEVYGGDREKMLSIAFTGGRGTRRTEAWTTGTWTFDVTKDAAENDLIRIVAEQAAGQSAWLPLPDPIFEERIDIDLGRSIYTVRPRRQFDAFVVYPDVSVLESLSLLHL